VFFSNLGIVAAGNTNDLLLFGCYYNSYIEVDGTFDLYGPANVFCLTDQVGGSTIEFSIFGAATIHGTITCDGAVFNGGVNSIVQIGNSTLKTFTPPGAFVGPTFGSSAEFTLVAPNPLPGNNFGKWFDPSCSVNGVTGANSPFLHAGFGGV
jgi:hypothetical protein